MSSIGRPLSVLIRTEHLMARRRMTVMRNQIALLLVAALAATLALVMLNVAGFYGLRHVVPPYAAALIVALADLAVAGIVARVALSGSADADAREAAALRDQALAQIEAQMDGTMAEIREITQNVQRLSRDPLGVAGSSLLAPLLARLLDRAGAGDKDDSA